nr:unnamed protein product [Callosobruchus chinensis]
MPQHTAAVFQRTFTYNAVRLINGLTPTLKNNFSETMLKNTSITNKVVEILVSQPWCFLFLIRML